ncbi:hypothetical protein AX16_010044 [Volvariella volvacea WC 439]|nr:hypothetical protein AX16_010044 [Volvariella volvacea WC 439]
MPPILSSLLIPNVLSGSSSRPKKRKALLIGITYGRGEAGSLKGPHNDVESMRHMLVDVYNYDPNDVVVMRDTGYEGDIPPTRANMMEQIQLLVEDAKPGDQFVFHYAGHGTQIENKDGTEEDGLDEALLPVDAPDNPEYIFKPRDVVMDDWLRDILVDCLPPGATLVAIIDACHSGSMLDLEHMKCNRVYVPWVSKGFRATKTKWHDVVRQDAAILEPAPLSRSISQILENGRQQEEPEVYFGRMCLSPTVVSMFPCDGWCREQELESPLLANVVCLSSADDSQDSWENREGKSMTQALVDLLYQNPAPTYREVLTSVSHYMHRLNSERHEAAVEYRKLYKKWVSKMKRRHGRSWTAPSSSGTPDMDNFQDPQFSSHMPLNMQDRWPIHMSEGVIQGRL